VKPVPKPKAKNATHGSVAVTTGKGAKGSSAVLSGVKKSVSTGSLRSRSTSVMPHGSVGPEGEAKADAEEVEVDADGDDQDNDDGKLYCICSTRYDEDRVMIACDRSALVCACNQELTLFNSRCDEWYHTQCVNIPDLEVDLVDQFICPPCVESKFLSM
jgi:COMPASS component SPP1